MSCLRRWRMDPCNREMLGVIFGLACGAAVEGPSLARLLVNLLWVGESMWRSCLVNWAIPCSTYGRKYLLAHSMLDFHDSLYVPIEREALLRNPPNVCGGFQLQLPPSDMDRNRAEADSMWPEGLHHLLAPDGCFYPLQGRHKSENRSSPRKNDTRFLERHNEQTLDWVGLEISVYHQAHPNDVAAAVVAVRDTRGASPTCAQPAKIRLSSVSNTDEIGTDLTNTLNLWLTKVSCSIKVESDWRKRTAALSCASVRTQSSSSMIRTRRHPMTAQSSKHIRLIPSEFCTHL